MSRVIKLMKTRSHIVIFYHATYSQRRWIDFYFFLRYRQLQKRWLIKIDSSSLCNDIFDMNNFKSFYKSFVIVYSTGGEQNNSFI